ncbi:MAG: glycosyltransferase family 25 protein [Cycloclasticus sp.]|nr:glycosyltransferase family 25 protein [Cycloclasticus sp.]
MNNKITLPIFIINLAHSVERKIFMRQLFEKQRLSSEFIKAIDGRLLGACEISGVYSKKKTIGSIGRELSANEIGCALSHKGVYQKIVDEGIELALILEDDVDFDKELLDVLNLVDKFPADWEIVLLGHHAGASRQSSTAGSLWGRKYLSSAYKLIRPCELACGAYGYLISQQGAVKLLNDLECIAKPLDHYTGDSEHVNLYAIDPAVISIHDDLSDNYHSMEDRNTLVSKHRPLKDRNEFSWYKRLLISLGIFLVVRRFLEQVRRLVNKIKPLRKYKSN